MYRNMLLSYMDEPASLRETSKTKSPAKHPSNNMCMHIYIYIHIYGVCVYIYIYIYIYINTTI